MIKKGLFLVLIVGIGFFIAPHAFAATFTVDSLLDSADASAGNGVCNDGSGNCTLRAAMDEASVLAGTDIINIAVTGTTSPTTAYANQSGQTVSIIGPGMDDFIIDAAAADVLAVFALSNVDNGTFSGFTITNVHQTGFLIGGGSDSNTFTDIAIHGEGVDTGAALIQLSTSSSNTISECELSEGGLGVRIQENSDYNTVENCTSTSQQHSGLTIYDSAYNTFSGNTITDSDEAGMFIIFGADHNTIENNIITDSTDVGITISNLGADSGTINNNIFRGNTITGTVDGNAIANGGDAGIEDTMFVGNIIKNNNGMGISVSGTGIVIGGTDEEDRNVIAGNTFGIHITDSSDVTIAGNYVGLDEDGTTALPNSFPNIATKGSSSNITIGGATSASRNYIAGNGDISIIIQEQSSDISIENNYLGLDINGDPVGGGEGYSLFIDGDANDIMVGGSTGVGNVISAAYVGIFIGTGTGVTIQDNLIGVDALGGQTSGYGNMGAGILIQSGGNKIGGVNAGEGNIIAGNGIGVFVLSDGAGGPTGNTILGNSINGNNGNSIDLAGVDGDDNPITGVTANDFGDTDAGPNDFLNHPVLISATQAGADTALVYALDVPISVNPYRVEFFTNPNASPESMFGEGEVYKDYENRTISSSGLQLFTATVDGTTAADRVIATITECTDAGCTEFGSTSEFSNAVFDNAAGIDLGTSSGSETAFSDDGAYHIIGGGALGECINSDSATKDDTEGGIYGGTGPCTDDRDGVIFDKTSYTVGDTMNATISALGDGYLSVWMDLDQDGSFDGVDEWLFQDEPVVSGAQDIALPVVAPTVGSYDIRFRYTTYDHEGLLATGEALDGEVEDYVIVTTTPVSRVRVVGSYPVNTISKTVSEILGSGTCPANLIIHDFMKNGDKNGIYSNYNKNIIKEVDILQAHINRILAAQYSQASGPVDGIFGKLTKQGVERLQVALNDVLKPVPLLKIDGIVGLFTRAAINSSCG